MNKDRIIPKKRRIEKGCWLKSPPFYQCCCTCVSHVVDHHYHSPELHKKGLCFKAKGYICLAPGLGATSDWPKHSVGCELHTTKEEEAKWTKRHAQELQKEKA